MPMGTKLGRVVTYHEGIPPIKSRDPLITWSCEITRQTKTIINSTTRLAVGSYQKRHMNVLSLLATKLGRTVTYLNSFLPIKSHDSFITWSYEITRQTKTITSPLLRYP